MENCVKPALPVGLRKKRRHSKLQLRGLCKVILNHIVISEKSNMIFIITPRNSPNVVDHNHCLKSRKRTFKFLRGLSKSCLELFKIAIKTGKDLKSLYQMLNLYRKTNLCPTSSYLLEIRMKLHQST